MNSRCRIALAIVLIALPACRIPDWQIWRMEERPPSVYEVERIRNVAYFNGPEADSFRHRVDLFLPKGKTDYPVVVLVHGGAWLVGDNRCCGLYSSVGEFLASQGIGAVLPNYRLSPRAKHPEHIKDLARAFAWTKQHIGDHGGDPQQMFLVGHSAGGHLVALLATDEQYLKAHGCSSADIRGVVGVSGVYEIPAGPTEVELGGNSPRSFRLDEVAPLRGSIAASDGNAPKKSGLPVRVNIFGPIFGNDPRARQAASPIHHVRPGLPPFLFLTAEKDLPLLPDMADEMHRRLLLHGCESRLLKIDNRNHSSVMYNAITADDPAAHAILQFVRASK
ncbi:MAG: alpha/beta hydrolase [Gemmataceae bacterium]|nr:alpha/beta hydrolase [Gemmataceae bacterium]